MQIKTNGVEWMAYTGQCHLYVLLRALHRRKWSQKHVRSVYNTYRKLHSANRMVPSAGAYDSRNGYRNQRLAWRAISASAKLLQKQWYICSGLTVQRSFLQISSQQVWQSADYKRSTNHKLTKFWSFNCRVPLFRLDVTNGPRLFCATTYNRLISTQNSHVIDKDIVIVNKTSTNCRLLIKYSLLFWGHFYT